VSYYQQYQNRATLNNASDYRADGLMLTLDQHFLTGVPRNLRVLPVVSKGSAGPPVLSKKLNCVQHLRPLETRFLGS